MEKPRAAPVAALRFKLVPADNVTTARIKYAQGSAVQPDKLAPQGNAQLQHLLVQGDKDVAVHRTVVLIRKPAFLENALVQVNMDIPRVAPIAAVRIKSVPADNVSTASTLRVQIPVVLQVRLALITSAPSK